MAYDPIKSWKNASERDVRKLARDWAADVDEKQEDVQQAVVGMNFTASSHLQWVYILEAVALAQTDDQLGAIAAGPMEHLLGADGDAYIGRFEKHAAEDPRFAKAVIGMWQSSISDANWQRIEAIKRRRTE